MYFSYKYKYQKYHNKIIQLKGGVIGILHSQEGRDWLETDEGYEFLEDTLGIDWLDEENGKLWLRTYSASNWLNNPNHGHLWLETDEGEYWLRSHYGYLWLWTDESGETSDILDLSNFKYNEEYMEYREYRNDNHGMDGDYFGPTQEEAREMFFIAFDQFHSDDNYSYDNSSDDGMRTTIDIDQKSPKQILDMIRMVFFGSSLNEYSDNNIIFETNEAVDQGGVSRQVYSDLLYHYFESSDITLVDRELLPELHNIPDIKTHFPNQNYFNCQSGNCNPINGFGTIVGYVLHLVQKRRLQIGFGFELENYMMSVLLMKSSNNGFIDNYCPEIKQILTNNTTPIDCNDINYENFPILSKISQLLTIYCQKSESEIYNEIDDLISGLDSSDKLQAEPLWKNHLKLLFKNEIINQCPNYTEIPSELSCSIPFNTLINAIIKMFELVSSRVYGKFISEIFEYKEFNRIYGNDFLAPLFIDEYQTKETLIEAIILKIKGAMKDKLISVLSNLEYEEIRKLLKFWTGSVALLNEEYKVEELTNPTFLPTASTCGYLLYIPNNNNEELTQKIKIAIGEITFQLV